MQYKRFLNVHLGESAFMQSNPSCRRIVVVRSPGRIAPWVMNDIAESLTFLGHDVRILDLAAEGILAARTASEALACANRVSDMLRSLKTDLVLIYGLAGLLELGDEAGDITHLYEQLGIPCVCLFFDMPFGMADSLARLSALPLTLFVCWDRSYFAWMRSLGVRRLFYMPLGTNIRVFGRNEPVLEPEYDCAFVGNINVDITDSPMPGSPAIQDVARRFIERRIEQPWRMRNSCCSKLLVIWLRVETKVLRFF